MVSAAAAQSPPSQPSGDPPQPLAAAADDHGDTQPYIVGFAEPALANYTGKRPGLPAPRRKGEGKGRIDVASQEARAYVADLALRQHGHEARMERAVGREVQVKLRMQHVFNGVITELSTAEAEALAQLPDVVLVEPYREYEVDTDTGPDFIGATAVWQRGTGLPPGQVAGEDRHRGPRNAKGEGMVYGILDSGINFGSPSFAAVGGDGYRHVNPFGSGNYLGTCAPGGVDQGRCNDKLIGGYDFVCGAPGNTCGVAGIGEEPGFGDNNSHGSHTASTAAGNHRSATFRGVQREISGVAPHGNLIAYDICYTRLSDGNGLCPNVSAVAAVNQAMADGVDVINYSIGGGVNPWSEAVSLGFLAATNAGIFVAASAGNSGPAANTLGHVEPWVTTVAALQHGRGGFEFLLNVTGPGTPPANVVGIVLSPGGSGVAHTASIPGSTPIRVSAGIDTAADGCAAFPANTFQGAIAVVRRGTCSFTIKTNNAAAAGAIAVVIANNAAGAIIPSVPGTTVPAFGILQVSGNALRDFAAGAPNATAAIPFPATVLANTPDQLGAFSSRGPANYDLIKPDVAAPGVAILAAVAGSTITGFENAVGLLNGTSMSSPHVAGAAGLLRQLYPSWTAAEIKSALMMTAKQAVLKEDGVTAADPLARGAGRIQVDDAARAGLVMDETTANYQAANPVTGGQVNQLNLPSYNNPRCIDRCTFKRTFRSTRTPNMTWNVKLEGVQGTVSPASFKIKGNEKVEVTVTIDSSQLPANASWTFGNLVLATHASHRAPDLHLPLGVAVPAPRIEASPNVNLSLPAGQNGQVAFDLRNAGGGLLNWNLDNSKPVSTVLHAASNAGVTSGTVSTFITDLGLGIYGADDFQVLEPTRLNFLSANGFTVSGLPVATTAQSVTWSIYPDANGVPAGNPETAPNLAVWSYTTAPNGPGMGSAGNWLMFDPTLAGQQVDLPPGKYWLVVNVRSSLANRWAWYRSNQASGSNAQVIQPSTATPWSPIAGFPGQAFEANGVVACGASWLGAVVPSAGSLRGSQSTALTVAVNTAGLAPGSYTGRVCLASNDPALALLGVPVKLTVTSP
ncbi:S8 family serine peptidase [Lysobacter koreensis]|uniref:S8 family serine peptidase n=1 Tax=Lysobacter koreensis TaxID=266122 RepID=A0ABW2YIZ3_9GAMM